MHHGAPWGQNVSPYVPSVTSVPQNPQEIWPTGESDNDVVKLYFFEPLKFFSFGGNPCPRLSASTSAPRTPSFRCSRPASPSLSPTLKAAAPRLRSWRSPR